MRYVSVLFVAGVCLLHGEVFARGLRRRDELCPGTGQRSRIYLEFADKGQVVTDINTNITNNNTGNIECSFELVTCPSCVIEFNISYSNASECHDIFKNVSSECLCDYVEISEHPYEPVSSTSYCGYSTTHRTKTRSVNVKLLTGQSAERAVFTYRALRNRVYLSEERGQLTSPFFPSLYPHDLNIEYFITCPTDNCIIKLLFSDFRLATRSIIEFFDWNGVRLDVMTGAHFRPPPIISSGPSLVVRFYANGGTSPGYAAEYERYSTDNNDTEPFTDCGGTVDNIGGAITMMDMVQGRYDCVWIVAPSEIYFKTHVYLKIVEFTKMGPDTRLVVHESGTSAGQLLEVLDGNAINKQPPREHVLPARSGLYVRLMATFKFNSRLAIAYAGFSYAKTDADCFTGRDFLCENRRCIARQLYSDSFDHCGDSTDEPPINSQPTRWYSRTPNYFFPNTDPLTDLRMATLVFVASSLGLVALVTALFILLYRISTRARRAVESVPREHHVQIISDLLAENEDNRNISPVPDEPPIYEAPPGYEECVKALEAARPKRSTRKRKRTRKHQRRPTTPPPRYEDERSKCRRRRRWRSYGDDEPLSSGSRSAMVTVKTLLMAAADTASDSELLNMTESQCATPVCSCTTHCVHLPTKFYTS